MSLEETIQDLKYRKKKFKKEFNSVLRRERREQIFNKIRNSDEEGFFLLEGDSKRLDNILFDINPITGEKRLDIPDDIIYRIDYSNVFFDNLNARGINFTGMLNVCLNPQTIFNKDMRDCILFGVHIVGRLDDVYITRTNFKGSTGVLIDPQTIYDKDLSGTILTDAIVVNNFEGVKLNNTSMDDVYLITPGDKKMIYGFQKIKE